MREGPGAIDAEHISGLAAGIHETLLNSAAASLHHEEPISLFNGWPKDWDAAFSLLARGGFVIRSAQRGGRIALVEIESPLGGECRLTNPWSGGVTLYRNGKKAGDLAGATLVVQTAKRETLVIVPAGASPQRVVM